MILLLLMGLGAARVKAQVRIGGNAAPNASAVLDLNADDTNSGTKGLALPRVALISNTMLLSGVTSNLTGMMVYNTTANAAIGTTIGIYFWNGATWVRANLPPTSPADSGAVLMSNGSTFVSVTRFGDTQIGDTIRSVRNDAVTWTKVLDTIFYPPTIRARTIYWLPATHLSYADFCYNRGNQDFDLFVWNNYRLAFVMRTNYAGGPGGIHAVCYRPSA